MRTDQRGYQVRVITSELNKRRCRLDVSATIVIPANWDTAGELYFEFSKIIGSISSFVIFVT